MTQSMIQVTQEGMIELSQGLNFKTVALIWEEIQPFLETLPQVVVDCQSLRSSDSAGVALLIELYRYAKFANKKILFKNLPEQFMNVARLSGITKLFLENGENL